MRVAIVTTSYPRQPGDASGHFVETEAVRWAESGAEVHVLAPGSRLNRPRGDCLHLHALGAVELFGPPGAWWRASEVPTRLLEAVPFFGRVWSTLHALGTVDALIAHFVVPSGFPLAACAAARARVVVAHGSDVRLLVRMPRRARSAVLRALLAVDARFRFASHALKDELLGCLPADLTQEMARSAYVQLPDIDLSFSRVRPLSIRPFRAPLGKLWATAGRLIPSKRVDLAIRLAADERATLLVIGDGPARRDLESLARRMCVEAHFLGQLPREETLKWLASVDRLVHLSEQEGAPSVVREARALGIPVLARPIGDLRSWAAADHGISLTEH